MAVSLPSETGVLFQLFMTTLRHDNKYDMILQGGVHDKGFSGRLEVGYEPSSSRVRTFGRKQGFVITSIARVAYPW
jgi:hypothetical protein